MKNVIILLPLIILLLVLIPVNADMGPKPTADIEVRYNNQPISDNNFYARVISCGYSKYDPLYSCVFKDDYINGVFKDFCEKSSVFQVPDKINGRECYWGATMLTWGGDQCINSKCHFWYSIPDEFKVLVYVPSLDKVFISNAVSNYNFNSEYQVNLLSDGSANIFETTPIYKMSAVSSFTSALIITLALELLIGYIFVRKIKGYKKILISIAIANFISLPIVWLIITSLGMSIFLITLTFSEVFAIIFEAYFIFYINKKLISINKKLISIKKSFIMSIVMNLVSLFIGGFIFLIISFFG